MKQVRVGIAGIFCIVLFTTLGHAQTGIISTYAGPPLPSDGALATASAVDDPTSVIPDGSGGFYVVSMVQSKVYRVTAGGVISTVAGTGSAGFSGDGGPAIYAQLRLPRGLAIDGSGNLYVADTDNHRVRKISGGVITTVAGTGEAGFSADGVSATTSQLNSPNGVAVDGSGNLYIADTFNHRVRKVTGGVISTVAGTGVGGFGGDAGTATLALLQLPFAVAVSVADDLYIADTLNNRIRKVTAGTITTVAGTGVAGFNGDDGPATAARIRFPNGVALDGVGNLYIADTLNQRIRKVTAGTITTIAGTGNIGSDGDGGPATAAELNSPGGVAVDGSGNVYIGDTLNDRVRKITGGTINSVAGRGIGGFAGDNGPATSAQLQLPRSVAVDRSGNVYIADTANSRIRKVTLGGVISTIEGLTLFMPQRVAVDSAGNLYIADTGNNRIRKVTTEGVISVIAGTGISGFSGEGGAATAAQLDRPRGVVVDPSGNVYIADTGNHRIRKITGGVINTVAGSGTPGFSGEGGAATAAQLDSPYSVAVDAFGALYIADTSNNRIRKVSAGVITTIAGSGVSGFSGDEGAATSAKIQNPVDVAADKSGNLYIADAGNNRIRKVSADGIISTVAGSGIAGFGGDSGMSTSAQLYTAEGVAVDGLGNLLIADTVNHRIRKVTMGLVSVFGDSTLQRGDFNADAKSDVIWQRTDGSTGLWLINGSTVGDAAGLNSSYTGWNVRKLGDFNGDGRSDIIWQHVDGSSGLWLMNGTIATSGSGLTGPATGWAVKDVGDFNGDGKSDILWQHVDGSVSIWLMNGFTVINAAGVLAPNSGWTVKRVSDFNGDGKSDLLLQHTDNSAVIWLMNGLSVTEAGGILLDPTSGWTVRTIGDFNGDGKSDLVWQHTDGSTGLWLMNGTGSIGGGGLLGPGTGWSVKHVGDVNGDGKSDVIWQHTDGSAGLWLLNGASVISGVGLIGPGTGWSVNRVRDVSGDGKADVVWQHTEGSASIWLMNGTIVTGATGLIGPGSGWFPIP